MTASVHISWEVSRAAGITALVLSNLSVTVGLLARSRTFRAKTDARPLHEVLALATLAMAGLHGLALLTDPWLRPGLAGVAVPFASAYRPLWTGLGIVALYGFVALGLSFYVRGRIGAGRWRSLHRFVALFWVAALTHSLGAGSDAGKTWFAVLLVVSAGPPLVMLMWRVLSSLESSNRPLKNA